MDMKQEYYSEHYYKVLQYVQKKLTEKYADLFGEVGSNTTKEQYSKMKTYIASFVKSHCIQIPEIPNEDILSEMLYQDMVEYSVLTNAVVDKKGENEEIDVNAWDDIEVIHRNGTKEKLVHFCNPEHAGIVIGRMAQLAGGKIDEGMPLVESDLPNNTRFVAMKHPIIDAQDSVAASIRIVRPAAFNDDFFIKNNTLTVQELRLIETSLKYGVSSLFIGETSSGKTTLMNCALRSLPNTYRLYTIETGSRELCLKKKDKDGNTINSVVSTLSRLSEDPNQNIDQDRLLDEALRFNPDVIAVGEMRGIESAAAVEAAMTDHTVITSLHAPDPETAHIRIAQLYCKKYPIDIHIAVQMAAQAFPLIISQRCLRDHTRHVMSITECVTNGVDQRTYIPLFRYHVLSNTRIPNTNICKTVGKHEVLNGGKPSDKLISRLLDKGIYDDELDMLLHPEGSK